MNWIKLVILVGLILLLSGCDTRGDLGEWIARNHFVVDEVLMVTQTTSDRFCYGNEQAYELQGRRPELLPSEYGCWWIQSRMIVCCRTGFAPGCSGFEISAECTHKIGDAGQ